MVPTLHLRRWLIVSLLGLALLTLSGCGVEPIFSYQGSLTDSGGNPVADGTYSATFKLFKAATGGTAVYSENRTLTVTDGLFDTEIGSSNVPTELYADDLFLEVTIEGETLTPRQHLRGAPYAFSLASGAVVQGEEVLNRTLGGQPNAGAALVVANFQSGTTGGHGLLGINNSSNNQSAALAGVAQSAAYGAYIQSEDYRGMYVKANDPGWYDAVFAGGLGISVNGNCSGCNMVQVAQNQGEQSLRVGDPVAVTGVVVDQELNVPVMQVRRATRADDVVIGVVTNSLRRTELSASDGLQVGGFDRMEGDAVSGNYVSIMTSGLGQVRVTGTVAIGDNLTAAANGAIRAAQPAALPMRVMSEPDKDGLVWVLIGQ